MEATYTYRPIEILLIEDRPEDIWLTKEALMESKLKINLSVATDGADALMFLNKSDKYTDAPKPDLILLDLNLPKKNGREVLFDIKQDDSLKTIPVVILTSSAAEQDIVKSYQLHANCYITKPLDLNQFADVVKSIEDFWFTIVKLPPAY